MISLDSSSANAPVDLVAHAKELIEKVAHKEKISPQLEVKTIGGTALGFVLATAFAKANPGVTMPSWTLASPEEVMSEKFELYVKEVAPPGSAGLLVKFSSLDESFTSLARRGANSSAHTQFRQVTDSTCGQVVSVARGVKEANRAIILQNIVSLSPKSGYFHLYVYGGRVCIEYASFSGARALFAGTSTEEYYLEEVGGATGLTADERIMMMKYACDFANFARDSLSDERIENWNIEGCWDRDNAEFYIFQSRPSPADRPSDRSPEPFTPSTDALWETHYVWGVFDFTVSTSEDPNVQLLIKKGVCSHEALPVETELDPSRPNLMITPDTGFRLSHEPFFLPSVPRRAGYFSVHVPESVLRRPILRFISDGEVCRVYAP